MSCCLPAPVSLLPGIARHSATTARRIAVMGGIYGNVPALEACLADARAQGAELFVCNGDMTGCCGHSDRTLELLRANFTIFVAGNHEQQSFAGAETCACNYANADDTTCGSVGHRYSLQSLSEENRAWLGTLPELATIETAAGHLLVCHGSPGQTNEFLYETELDEKPLAEWLDLAGARALICTHSGFPWLREVGDGRLAINAGVVGKPDHDGETAVHYALLSVSAGGFRVDLRRVEYDAIAWVAQITAEGVEPIFTEPLLTGVWTIGVASMPDALRSRQERVIASRRPDDKKIMSNPESAVKERYAAGAQAREAELCCPVSYDPQFLKVIPAEVIERDYGCGDPSKHVRSGETVLDLGSGTGKICFIAAQVVGPKGRVIGVDMTDDMLEVARRNAPVVAERIGYANVEFRKGRIQDLALDLQRFDDALQANPITGADSYHRAGELAAELRLKHPLVPSDSIDVVVSNCVLNLVEGPQKQQLFAELFRVLKKGGRAVISDIVSDEEVPVRLQQDPELWSGCISGAFTEEGFLKAFEDAGFHGIRVLVRDAAPWRTVEGIEFRSLTVEAFKGAGAALERNQAVVYRGPFTQVEDERGNVYPRGVRIAVSDRTFAQLQREPYAGLFDFIEPMVAVEQPAPFDCERPERRHPRESKGLAYDATTEQGGSCCSPGGICC